MGKGFKKDCSICKQYCCSDQMIIMLPILLCCDVPEARPVSDRVMTQMTGGNFLAREANTFRITGCQESRITLSSDASVYSDKLDERFAAEEKALSAYSQQSPIR
jgi:hypothetical protein